MYARFMTAAPEPYIRLAQYIERRISDLTLEYAEVCRRAGISDETLGKIRKGMRARSATYQKLERALEWGKGSISAILADGEPTLLHAPLANIEAAIEAAAPSMSPRELEMLAGILATLAEGREMSDADMAATLRRAQQIIQERRRERAHRADQSNVPPQDRAV